MSWLVLCALNKNIWRIKLQNNFLLSPSLAALKPVGWTPLGGKKKMQQNFSTKQFPVKGFVTHI